jgi:outer membrane protein assembly factor BamB
VASTDGYEYILDPKDGTNKAKFNTGESWATSLLTSDALYVATMKGELWKLDPTDLHNLWPAPFKTSAALLTNPKLVGDDMIVVGGIGKTMYGIETTGGTEKWSASGGNWFWGEPLVDGTTVYVTDLDGEVKALDGTTGKSVWSADFKALNSTRAGAVMTGDTLVVVDNSGVIYRLEKATGNAIGQPNLLNEDVLTTPLVLAGAASGASSTATAAAGASGSVSATATISATPTPVASTAAGGQAKVYIVTQSGNMYEFDADAAKTTQVVQK